MVVTLHQDSDFEKGLSQNQQNTDRSERKNNYQSPNRKKMSRKKKKKAQIAFKNGNSLSQKGSKKRRKTVEAFQKGTNYFLEDLILNESRMQNSDAHDVNSEMLSE